MFLKSLLLNFKAKMYRWSSSLSHLCILSLPHKNQIRSVLQFLKIHLIVSTVKCLKKQQLYLLVPLYVVFSCFFVEHYILIMLMAGNLSSLVELLLSRPSLDEITCDLYSLKKTKSKGKSQVMHESMWSMANWDFVFLYHQISLNYWDMSTQLFYG